jgi:hypothetical protein
MSETPAPDEKQPPEIEAKWADKSRVPLNYYGREMAFGKIWVALIFLGIALIAVHCDPVLSRNF